MPKSNIISKNLNTNCTTEVAMKMLKMNFMTIEIQIQCNFIITCSSATSEFQSTATICYGVSKKQKLYFVYSCFVYRSKNGYNFQKCYYINLILKLLHTGLIRSRLPVNIPSLGKCSQGYSDMHSRLKQKI